MATNYQGYALGSISPNPTSSVFQPQQLFPQPQGNIYLINNSLEMANVPTGAGVSVALCLPEGVMYLKTLQNGAPMFVSYKISPLDSNESSSNPSKSETIDDCLSRIEALEKEINTLKRNTECNLKDYIR